MFDKKCGRLGCRKRIRKRFKCEFERQTYCSRSCALRALHLKGLNKTCVKPVGRYQSQKAAAADLGVCEATVSRAKSKGTLDKLLSGAPVYPQGGNPPQPVRIDGVEYESMGAAQRALGLNYHDVKALNEE